MKNKSILVGAIVLLFGLLKAEGAYFYFDDGQVHNIDYTIDGHVMVDEFTTVGTTINVLVGGNILNLLPYNNSKVNISGGLIGRNLQPYDSAYVTITSGSIGRYLNASGSSRTDMFGGSIDSDVYLWGDSQLNLYGGSIGGKFVLSGNSKSAPILTIYGSDFFIDGEPLGYGEITSTLGRSWVDEPLRYLTGTLANGNPINNDFLIGDTAKIILVPEPATLLLLGLGAVMLRRKH